MLLHTFFKSCRMFREGGGSPYSDHDGDGGMGDKRIYVNYLYFKFKFQSVLDKHTSAKLCHGFSHEFFQTFLIVSKTKRFFSDHRYHFYTTRDHTRTF